jgi:hypothetical protein
MKYFRYSVNYRRPKIVSNMVHTPLDSDLQVFVFIILGGKVSEVVFGLIRDVGKKSETYSSIVITIKILCIALKARTCYAF